MAQAVREAAALICAIAASGGVWRDSRARWSSAYLFIASELDSPPGALTLAVKAYHRAMKRMGTVWTRDVDAEAESLLRTGWSP